MKALSGIALAVSFLVAPYVQAQEPIKIGFVAELSGPQGVLGTDQYDAFMLAVEANDGKLGGVPVQIFKEDSMLKPEIGVQAVQKLIEREGVQIITGVTFSNIMMAILKPVTEKEVFLIGSNGGPAPAAGAECSPYLFMTSWQNDMQSEVVGKYASEQGYKKVIAMAPNYQAGKDYINGFKRYFSGEVIDEIYTPLNQPDFSAELTRVAAEQPDAVFIFYPGGLGINFVRQYHQLGLGKTIPLLTTATMDGTTLPAMKEAALGVKTGTYWSPDLAVPANVQFIKDFQEKYNRLPSQYAAQSYDAALLLDSAIAKVGGNLTDKQAFMTALKAADFQSTRGDFRFGNNNFPIQNLYMLEAAKDADGNIALKTIATPLKDHQDAYHDQCAMK
ncbi:ABC transporter substrate-binding protein [Eoetvoesiella caeni]|uniref:Branched-chain amino acid transport system substrate-binding protein n=1 Tax=Eoetvoesiella caeni TaxID=645616 RepID=A0A366GY31_9BURK|nr:ABC transporter substrate-binding protein [Eoetvoesiella caeni]MCI2811247.1 ABC transporter substrate-binding protein [Eoetvoesiella caeni]NYT57144.1 ABC transporter substrate-binding protein [Eoetvoesiella caeni]RBP33656.1 branched-chain amino acid transport system substrate-binding protein [Eoetvoesiella caeni]